MKTKCKCDWIAIQVNDPNVPIEYLENVKEFAFKYSPRKSVYNFLYIHHCPLCGGKLSALNKNGIIPKKELQRLSKIIEKIFTSQDALEILGNPDKEQENGTMEWYAHSKTAIIEGYELHPNKFFINFRKK